MFDIFASDIINPVSVLKQYEFLEPVYHSDGMGHVQEQLLVSDQPCSLEGLLERIEEDNDWDSCLAMFEEQPKVWLLSFSEKLGNIAYYHTKCNMQIFSLLTERSDIIAFLQDADRWFWDISNRQMIPVLIKKIESMLTHHYSDDLEKEFDTSILTTVKLNLERLYKLDNG
ncbi:hypothetical protein EKG38_11265 [Shewanella canadensis]|uniref:DUF4123 domain-containing protein n=1 Tax=Shewanella canadensis TaxID=271096 RepID=A0A431WT69_9GAMM|nr:hypothetical protein [Shewanella canadensis]RTR38741.1 hypothetical protein EKG38_11265 [Shewanella canadensis]